ncbi:unnamed protein product [Rotaria magnacalcarata]|uniref:Uncharacterized protein n=2 Tax=Rotaria magnacalcarata TaxID=392030 RepID=A0A819T3H4_9BILA|nr:unnamed protein product [Rotaria magnacalcarata]CAF1683095.1 unnamed protein product [Rotaria magnacalcarata]CAF2027586.1 unnamed protein product [Rotaria magnacalcarata]CAF2055365.1 unnamed protein product [Rotaria magnacalcarata]CAF2145865.1 unnamed protein product [Rotaria magnacalcarata]
MLPLLFILIIQHISAQSDLTSNETRFEVEQLNRLQFEHEAKVHGHGGHYHFTILNTNYAKNVLNISSYYLSITYIDEQSLEERLDIVDFHTDEVQYSGALKMEYLEAEGNYLICVFFLKNNRSGLIGSSRFCHVVSVADTCQLEELEVSFANQPVYLLIILVVVLLAAIVIFSYIRAYMYRPRTVEDYLSKLPDIHTEYLQELGGQRIISRLRFINPALNQHLQTGSIDTIIYDDKNQPVYANASLDAIAE